MPSAQDVADDLRRVNYEPETYTPRIGDVLRWEGIVLKVTAVGDDDTVALEAVTAEKITSDSPGSAFIDRTPDEATPLGVTTWAETEYEPTTEDIRRMVKDGWNLISREWEPTWTDDAK